MLSKLYALPCKIKVNTIFNKIVLISFFTVLCNIFEKHFEHLKRFYILHCSMNKSNSLDTTRHIKVKALALEIFPMSSLNEMILKLMLGLLNEIFKFSAKKTIDQEANYIFLTRKVSNLTITFENPASYIVFTTG